ncbi:phthiocerol/phthiodiolone dimycocerosyl transferase family protein [Gulbenkiania mobilis]|uniref:phthiocerol/phthiodiolone dimycocerosyl transferase family protein n=1 Tax=Gulbenkiania mobilis TaxID=397457 RepID=UPI0006BBEE3B|nr:condensation domain-containing protein [Gulbenkiania mobilis]
MPVTAPARPLDPAERFFWMLDRLSTMNFLVLAELAGHVEPATLKAALNRVQACHPMARVRIDRSAAGDLEFVPDVTPIPLAVQVTTAREDALAATLAWRFQPNEAPLIRALWLPAEGGGWLALTFHHAIADGRSAMAFLQEVLAAAAGEQVATTHPLHPPLHALYPPQWQAEARGEAAQSVRQARKAALKRHGRPETLPAHRPSANPAHPALARILLSAPTTSALQRYARAAGTTVHGLIGAAQLLALCQTFGDDAAHVLSLTSPVDLRASLVEPVSQATPGFYVSLLTTNAHVMPGADLKDLARTLSDDIRLQRERGDGHLLYEMMAPLIALPATDAGLAAFGEAVLATPPSSLVSNVGVIEGPALLEGLTVERLSFALCPMPYQPLFTAVSTWRGEMTLNLNWDAARLESSAALKVREAMAHHLHTLAASAIEA